MVTTLTGNNAFGLRAELNKLISGFTDQFGDLALEKFDGDEASVEQIFDAVQALPFLSPKKMVVVRNVSSLPEANEKIGELVALAGETDLVLYEPKLDKRTSLYKTLKTKSDFKELNELEGGQLSRWLVDEAKKEGAELSFSDASYLISRGGHNQMMLSQEIAKLALYEPKITRQNIDLLVEPVPQSRIFDLLDAAFAGQALRALELYEDQRAQKAEPQQILAMITWQLGVLATVIAAGNRPADEIARQARISPYSVRKCMDLKRKITLTKLKQLVADLLEIDIKSKTSSYSLDDGLRHFIISINQA